MSNKEKITGQGEVRTDQNFGCAQDNENSASNEDKPGSDSDQGEIKKIGIGLKIRLRAELHNWVKARCSFANQ